MADELTTSCFIAVPVSRSAAEMLSLNLYVESDDGIQPVDVGYYEHNRFSPSDIRVVGPWDMHVTLVYIDALPLSQADAVLTAVERLARLLPSPIGRLTGVAEFLPGSDGYPCVALVDSLDLGPLRDRLIGALDDIPYSRSHGFIPHITLAYSWMPHSIEPKTLPDLDLVFPDLQVVIGGKDHRFRFAGGIGKSVSTEILDNATKDSDAIPVRLEESQTARSNSVDAVVTKAVWSTAFVNDLPDSSFLYIESGGEKEDGKTTPRSLRHFPVKDADGKVDAPHVRNAIARIPQSNAPGLTAAKKTQLQEKARRMLGEGEEEKVGRRLSQSMLTKLSEALDTIKGLVGWANYSDDDEEDDTEKTVSSFAVFKDAAGEDRWISWSSNAFRDREREIVSTAALIGAVAKADLSGDRGPLLLWHTPEAEIGVCDFQCVEGRFLIESGTFLDTPLAEKAKASLAAYEEKFGEPLGTSIGFSHPLGDELDGVYDDVTIFERSVCPLRVAANPFTSFHTLKGEAKMDEHKRSWLAKMIGDDETAAIVERAGSATKGLEELFAFKAVKAAEDATTPPAAPADAPAPAEASEPAPAVEEVSVIGAEGLTTVLTKTLTPISDAIKALDTVVRAVSEKDAARDASLSEITTALTDLTARVTEIEKGKALAPRSAPFRATESDQNLIDAVKAGLPSAENPPTSPVRPYLDDLIRQPAGVSS